MLLRKLRIDEFAQMIDNKYVDKRAVFRSEGEFYEHDYHDIEAIR